MPSQLYLSTIDGESGPVVAVVDGALVYPLAGVPSMRAVLADLDSLLESSAADLEAGRLGAGLPIADVSFQPPVPDAPNLYMAGANYADHTREMRKLPPGAPVDRPAAGPFIFLKPTTTLTGHGKPVVRPASVKRLDWEVELGVVIGRRAHHVAEAHALEYVAGYTVLNDISARDAFVREGAEPAMTMDWLGQKGWYTSCPAGPWLIAARDCPDPSDLALTLKVNGELMQDSRTSEMVFSIPEQIAYLSRVVPLVPGDIIGTGTCAGVGMGRGKFLEPGDVMLAEVERIGVLENQVVDEEQGD